jgi:hypothetical protein
MLSRITTRDVMIDNLDELFMGIKADCLYCDPPWGEASMRYWRTMNNQKGHPVDWIAFLDRINYLYDRHVTGPLFLETGIRFENDLIRCFGKPNIRFLCKYKTGNKVLSNLLLCWGTQPTVDINGMSGFDIVFNCLSSYKHTPKIVFDPCFGKGMTARACKKINAVCFANELNNKRAKYATKTMTNFVYLDGSVSC